jgi:hypothetical protein
LGPDCKHPGRATTHIEQQYKSGILGLISTAGFTNAAQGRRWLDGHLQEASVVLVPLALFGAFNYGWSVSHLALTESRAARIQGALVPSLVSASSIRVGDWSPDGN